MFKIIKKFRYVLCMILGAILFVVGHDVYFYYRFTQDMNTLVVSNDYDRLYKITSAFWNTEKNSVITQALIGQERIQNQSPSVDARMAALHAIEDSEYFSLIPLALQGGMLNSKKEIREESIRIYDKIMGRYYRGNLFTIAKRLEDETSPEIFDKKMDLLARYLYISKKDLLEKYKKDGPRPFTDFVYGKLKDTWLSDQCENINEQMEE